MKKYFSSFKLVLVAEGLGFLSLLFITWIDEGIALPRHWLGTLFGPGTFHEALLESLAIIVVGSSVTLYTNHLLKRLHYLESFLRVCAWCRQLHLKGEWVPMETYLKLAGDIECSHGICPACEAKVRQEFVKDAMINASQSSTGPQPHSTLRAAFQQEEHPFHTTE